MSRHLVAMRSRFESPFEDVLDTYDDLVESGERVRDTEPSTTLFELDWDENELGTPEAETTVRLPQPTPPASPPTKPGPTWRPPSARRRQRGAQILGAVVALSMGGLVALLLFGVPERRTVDTSFPGASSSGPRSR